MSEPDDIYHRFARICERLKKTGCTAHVKHEAGAIRIRSKRSGRELGWSEFKRRVEREDRP